MSMTPEQRRAWRKANPEKDREQQKRYKDANREKINAQQREYFKRPEVRKRANKHACDWAKANRHLVNEMARKRYHADIEATRAYRRKRDAATRVVRRMRAAQETPPGTTLYQNAIYAAAHAAVPRGLPSDIRDDVISEIVVAVLCGDILESEIAASAKRFVTAFYRQFDRFKTISLDAPIPGTDGLRLIDTLEAAE